MNKAAKGRRREWQVRAALEAAGYVVIRAAASKGPCDLAAWAPTTKRNLVPSVIVVQVKSAGWPSPDERRRFSASCARARLIVHWPDREKPRAAYADDEGHLMLETETTDWFRGLVRKAKAKPASGAADRKARRCPSAGA